MKVEQSRGKWNNQGRLTRQMKWNWTIEMICGRVKVSGKLVATIRVLESMAERLRTMPQTYLIVCPPLYSSLSYCFRLYYSTHILLYPLPTRKSPTKINSKLPSIYHNSYQIRSYKLGQILDHMVTVLLLKKFYYCCAYDQGGCAGMLR